LLVVGDKAVGKSTLIRKAVILTENAYAVSDQMPNPPELMKRTTSFQTSKREKIQGLSYVPTLGVGADDDNSFVVPIHLIDQNFLVEILCVDVGANIGSMVNLNSLVVPHMRCCNALMLVYDLTSVETLDSLEFWVKQSHLARVEGLDPYGCVVGTKADVLKERKDILPNHENRAEEFGFRYFRTSAVTDSALDAFVYVAKQYVTKYEQRENELQFMSK